MNSPEYNEVCDAIFALNEVSRIVNNTFLITQSMPTELQKEFAMESLEMVRLYDEAEDNLRVSLEKWFIFEKENNLPARINFRKVYKMIMSKE